MTRAPLKDTPRKRTFDDSQKRREIYVSEIREIFERQYRKINPDKEFPYDAKYKSYMVKWLSLYGVCEFSGESINGQPTDWEHEIPLKMLREGDPIKWQIILRKWHPAKTAQDVKDIARAKRRAGLTGQRARREAAGGSRMQSRGFQKDGPKQKIQSRGFPKKGERHSNVR